MNKDATSRMGKPLKIQGIRPNICYPKNEYMGIA